MRSDIRFSYCVELCERVCVWRWYAAQGGGTPAYRGSLFLAQLGVLSSRDLQLCLQDYLVGDVRLSSDLLLQLAGHVRDEEGDGHRYQDHQVL